MDVASVREQVQDVSLNTSGSTSAEFVKIASTLGNADALAIFLFIGNGMKSSKDAIRTIGLTQKRYYQRLKELIDANLITKVDGEYRYTPLGKFARDNIKEKIEPVLANKERLTLIDKIGEVGSLSPEEAQRIAQILSIDELTGFQVNEAKVVDMFDTAVNNVIKFIDNARKSIHIASKYMDIRVNQACMNAVDRGVETYFILGDIDQFKKSLNMICPIMGDSSYLRIIIKFLGSSDMNVRFIELPYTFLIVDGRQSMIEVPRPFTDVYTLSIFFENEVFTMKLIENFDILWERASEIDEFREMP